MNDSSSPASPSSNISRLPPGPNSLFSMALAMNSRASAASLATSTPFPAHSPSALITTGHFTSPNARYASSAESYAPYIAAVGIPCRTRNSFVNTLLPSSCAACRLGPMIAHPRLLKASTTPFTSGSSGPTTVKSGPSFSPNFTSPAISSISAAMHSPSAAIPPFPGAHQTLSTPSLKRSFHTNAYSRPPAPITRTFIEFSPQKTLSPTIAAARDSVNAAGSPSTFSAHFTKTQYGDGCRESRNGRSYSDTSVYSINL